VLTEIADTSPDALSQLERRDSAALLRGLVRDSLTEVEARVMTLHYAEELPLQAVTQLLQLENASGAKAYIVSAKRKLARALMRSRPGARG
jgi:flagellar motor switch protein FliG